MWLAGASSPAPMLNACTRNETVKPLAPAGLTVAVPNLPSSFIIVTTSESPARRGGMRRGDWMPSAACRRHLPASACTECVGHLPVAATNFSQIRSCSRCGPRGA